MIKNDDAIQEFSLFGGPLQRLGRRLGLVRGRNSFWLGAALGWTSWVILVVLALLRGAGDNLFSWSLIGVHVRFLVAVPLFFLCETWVAPRMADFVRNMARSGLVPETEMPALAAAVRRIGRLRDPWPAEIFFFVLAVTFPLISASSGALSVTGRSGDMASLLSGSGGHVGPALVWYLGFCLPLFRFFLLRWVWHLGLWCYFLWRVQRLNLHLVASHPDHAAGLGYLEIVQEHFGTLAFAVSAVYSASFAENIVAGTMNVETLYLAVPAVVILIAVLFAAPLLFFSPKLWACRIAGWSEYMGMASRYVNQFDRKWIRGENPAGEPLLGTADMQSLADLNNSVNVVREMRWFPAGRRVLLSLSACAILPLLPLLLLKYPIDELAVQLFKTITGL